MAKRKKDRNKKKNKKNVIPIKSILSLSLVIFSLAVANLSFLSFARDVLFETVSEDINIEVIKEISITGIESIKAFFADEEEDINIINDIPPELLLPGTE